MILQGVQIGEKALSLFMKVATKLQECGGKTDDNNLWSFAIDSSSNAKNAICDSSLDSIRHLEAVEDVLHDLLESCKRKLRTIKVDSQRPVSGSEIQDLPDDVLSDIFKFAVERNDVPRRSQSRLGTEGVLTHICSRFRSLALSIPTVWSRLESTMPHEYVAARLQLSKDCLLKIVIKTSSAAEIQQFIRLVTPHVHRWISFDSEYPPYHASGSLQLPKLEFLNVQGEHLRYCRNWNMPKLQYISISGWKRRIPLAAFSAHSVRSLDLDQIPFGLKVVDYLTSVPNLAELCIATCDASPLDLFGAHGSLPNLRKMTLRTNDRIALLVLIFSFQLPELSVLELDVDLCAERGLDMFGIHGTLPRLRKMTLRTKDEIALLVLFGHLQMPELSVLEVDIILCAPALHMSGVNGTLPRLRDMTVRTNNGTALRVLVGRLQLPELLVLRLDICREEVWDMAQIQSFQTYPSVKELSISYDSWSRHRAMDLPPLFVLLPEMQRLNLLSPCSNFEFRADVKPPPLLSCSAHVRHTDCYFLRQLVERLKQHGRWEQFEFFELIVESSFSLREADDIFTKEKVRWHGGFVLDSLD